MGKSVFIPGIPKTETIEITFRTTQGDVYYTTTKTQNRKYYYLYKLVDGVAQKLGKANNPVELEEKFIKN
jgi:hypothetical protein